MVYCILKMKFHWDRYINEKVINNVFKMNHYGMLPVSSEANVFLKPVESIELPRERRICFSFPALPLHALPFRICFDMWVSLNSTNNDRFFSVGAISGDDKCLRSASAFEEFNAIREVLRRSSLICLNSWFAWATQILIHIPLMHCPN